MERSQEYSANWARERYNSDEEYREAKRQRNNEWAKNNREKKTAALRRVRAAKRKQCIEHLGGKCCGCGVTENLQFDHIDRTKKSFTIGKCLGKTLDVLMEEANKCQLLCKECHQHKTTINHDMNQLAEGYNVKEVKRVGDDVIVTLSKFN